MKLKTIAAIALFSASTVVSAQWYGAASGGSSTTSIKNSDIGVGTAGVTTSSVSKNESSSGYKLQLGYQFNPHFAVEGGYVDLGKFKGTNNTSTPAGSLSNEMSATGWNATAVGLLPMSEKFIALGKAGLLLSSAKYDLSTTGSMTTGSMPRSGSKSDINLIYGLGLQYNLNKTLAFRAEFETFTDIRGGDSVEKRDVVLYSAGLIVKF